MTELRLIKTTAKLGFAYSLLIAPWPPFVALLAFTAVFGVFAPLAQIAATTALIDALTANSAAPPASLFAAAVRYLPQVLLLVGAMLANWLITMDTFQRYVGAQLNERVKERFDERLYTKALSLRLERFESPVYYDALQRAHTAMDGERVSYDMAQVSRLVAAVFGCIAILWALGQVFWPLSALLLISSILLVRWRLRANQELIDTSYVLTNLDRRMAYWRGLLTGRPAAAEVRMFGLAGYVAAAWQTLADERLQTMAARRRGHLTPEILLTTAHNDGLYCIIGLALLYAASQRQISAGTLVALLTALGQYGWHIHNISWRLKRFQRLFADLGYVREFFALEGEERAAGATTAGNLGDGIRFENVGFTYSGAVKPSLSAINLHIRPGERVALLGLNGAGKSTLAKLLLGLYQPTNGRICVGGVDLQLTDPRSWRSNVGAVMQEHARYAFTLAENIGFGQLKLLNDRYAIEQAAQRSSAAQIATQLPEGYDTLLGKEFDGGHDLSLGQWQKLAIARAYLRDAPVVVLDEPASALDALAELALYRQFLDLSAGKTVLLISHRLGSARLADRIVFLQDGQIAEQGTHAELLATGGAYAEMYAMQAEWYR